MLTTADACKRKLCLFLAGLEPVGTPSYFTFGRVWQEALEVWYVTEGPIEMKLAAAMSAAERNWADSGSASDGVNNVETLKFLLMAYAIEYETEPWTIIKLGDKVEFGFQFPLPGTEWFLGGAIDGYIDWPPYGKLVLENKTAGVMLNDTYMSQWSMSSQVTQYFWGLTQLLGEPPFGVLMNMACKRVSQKAINEFKTSFNLPEGLFARNLEKRSSFKIKEFERDTRLLIEDINREFDRGIWPKTKDSIECSGGIGKSPCSFRRLCLIDAQPWELDEVTLLGNDLTFRPGVWEPWKRGGAE